MTARLIPSTSGVVLEAIVEEPPTLAPNDRLGTVVLCHPHPVQGGTMRNPILGAIAVQALKAGFVTVRFNFRGVGESTGAYDNGLGEVSDVGSVVDFVERELPPLVGVAGWSFGAAVSLGWQARSGSQVPWVGIAPPVNSPLTPNLPEPDQLEEARRLFIVGERDQFVDVDALAVYAGSIGAGISIYPGSDHFFVFKHNKLADDVVAALRPI